MNSAAGFRPRIALTMGDVAGIGPEIIVRCLSDRGFRQKFQPIVVGCPVVFDRAIQLLNASLPYRIVENLSEFSNVSDEVVCWNPSQSPVQDVPPSQISGAAGKAAYDWLVAATHAALRGEIHAIVTAPLNKAALHAGEIHYPGHTEILAHECGVQDFAMMLHLPPCHIVKGPVGLSVAHVTLHTSIASVPGLLNQAVIQEKIGLMFDFLQQIGCQNPRIGVCALNPHAGEEGLFGDEEIRLIGPAVADPESQKRGARGPFPADTLIARSVQGEFDGVVAMYHDQGHIALKLIAFQLAVNVTLGLPIIRTSPSHGTGFDIAWQGLAQDSGMRAAIDVAFNMSTKKFS